MRFMHGQRRKSWPQAARDALGSGTGAAVLSTLALATRGKAETGSVFAPTNAISHWIWGDRSARRDAPSARYTLVGYLTHHAASIFWALFYERWFGEAKDRGDVATALAGGAAISALACFVDYRLTPHRLRPGYEMRLSKPSLGIVYVSFGIGLAVGVLFNRGTAGSARRDGHPRLR